MGISTSALKLMRMAIGRRTDLTRRKPRPEK